MKGAQTALTTTNAVKSPRKRLLRHKNHPTDSLLESGPLSALAWGQECSRVRINGESCMALLDNGAQINTIMPKCVSDHFRLLLVMNHCYHGNLRVPQCSYMVSCTR